MVVNSPAGTLTSDAPILLQAAEPLVINTPFAPWTLVPAAAGGQALVSLSSYQALRIFVGACRVGPASVDQAAAVAVSVWRVGIHDAAWSRILTEYKTSGYAAAPINTLRQSGTQLQSLAPANPASPHLMAAD